MYVQCTVNLCIATLPSQKCPDLCTRSLNHRMLVNSVLTKSYTVNSGPVSLVVTTPAPTTTTQPTTTTTAATTVTTTTTTTAAVTTTTKAATTSHGKENNICLFCFLIDNYLLNEISVHQTLTLLLQENHFFFCEWCFILEGNLKCDLRNFTYIFKITNESLLYLLQLQHRPQPWRWDWFWRLSAYFFSTSSFTEHAGWWSVSNMEHYLFLFSHL